jgi:2-oxoisovalerate dehydrogenase E1 component beta subunit
MTEVSLVQAVNLALRRAMSEDSRVLVLGEDVGVDGGVFRATIGLLDLYGAGRVLDIQFTGFAYSCIDQLLNHASRLRTRTRGRLTCPLVLRAPSGGGIHAIEHHSESPEAIFAHIPGLKVVIPSSPARAYGLLLSAIRDPDPVVFLEPTRLYRAARERVIDDGAGIPLETCFILRSGRDVTLVSWGAMLKETLEAADRLSLNGIEAEVIDVATLKPLDSATILESVNRTGRLVVVHEAPLTGGFGAEIAARVAAAGLMNLLAPIERVAGYDTIMPYPRTESAYMPNVDRVMAAARGVVSYQ